jgi:hypothetical protein
MPPVSLLPPHSQRHLRSAWDSSSRPRAPFAPSSERSCLVGLSGVERGSHSHSHNNNEKRLHPTFFGHSHSEGRGRHSYAREEEAETLCTHRHHPERTTTTPGQHARVPRAMRSVAGATKKKKAAGASTPSKVQERKLAKITAKEAKDKAKKAEEDAIGDGGAGLITCLQQSARFRLISAVAKHLYHPSSDQLIAAYCRVPLDTPRKYEHGVSVKLSPSAPAWGSWKTRWATCTARRRRRRWGPTRWGGAVYKSNPAETLSLE